MVVHSAGSIGDWQREPDVTGFRQLLLSSSATPSETKKRYFSGDDDVPDPGEEIVLETAELTALEGKGNRLGPEELGLLAKQLASASDSIEAARIKERLTRGFYGI